MSAVVEVRRQRDERLDGRADLGIRRMDAGSDQAEDRFVLECRRTP
jgi:hypothetical protein